MSATPSMILLDSRQDSFKAITKPKSKAKPAFPLDPAKFPHLTPDNLASAGFFHDPESDEENWDTCKCFLCGLKLGGWDEGDDPFEEHMKRGQCAWAEFVCQPIVHRRKRKPLVWETAESLPLSAESSTTREKTYIKAWPHKQKTNWLPTAQNLAQAGFVYNGTSVSKDLVQCPLCEYAVEGWEAEDDPREIHYNKSPECLFFTATAQTAAGASQGKPGRKTKKNARATEVAQSQSQPVSELPEDEPEASTSQAPLGKPRVKRGATAKGKGKQVEEADNAAEVEISEIDASEVEVEAPKTTRTRGKGRAKANEIEAESQAESGIESLAEEEPSQPVKKPARGKGRKQTIAATQQSEVEEIGPSGSEVEADDATAPVEEQKSTGKPTRKPRRQTRKPAVKATVEEVIVPENEGDETIVMERQNDTVILGTEGTEESQSKRSKAASSKARRETRKPSAKSQKSVQSEVEEAREAEIDEPVGEEDLAVESLPEPKSQSTSSRSGTSKKSAKSNKSMKRVDPEPSVLEESIPLSEIENESQPSRPSSRSKSTSSRTTKTTAKSRLSKSTRTKQVPVEENEEPSEMEVDEPAPQPLALLKKSTRKPRATKQTISSSSRSKSSKGKAKEKADEPVVATQLDRFANIPPSSPFPNAFVDDTTRVSEAGSLDLTPRASRPVSRSDVKSSQSSQANLAREQLEKSLVQGATEARRVMEDVILNLAMNEEDLETKLTEDQKKMTLEELIRLEFRKRHAAMQKEGEGMIARWGESTTQVRRQIEGL